MGPDILHRHHILTHGLGLGHLSHSSNSSSQKQPDTISAFKQIDEETLPKYNADAFYPVRLDEVLHDRYKVVSKLGFGVTATVWLARDLHTSIRADDPKYVAIKINVNTLTEDWLKGRGKIAERLATTNPKHPGYKHVRFMRDTFRLKGPHGQQHLCIVYDVLREPIDLCMEKWPGRRFKSDKLRILLPALLQGLDYLHTECHVVHTDLKPDNIMMGLGDPAVLDRFVQDEADHPSPRKMPDSHGRVIYQSRSDFGAAPTDAVIASAKITDLGLAVFGDEHNNSPIQTNAFTCPEVILAAGWSYPADIWNLGVMLWDLFEDFGLFDGIDTRKSHYHSNQHLGLMIALMGPPPKKLLDRGSTSATYFDEKGEFRDPSLIPKGFSFESSITCFHGKDKELFIDFAKKMICWLPEERWTAKQLLEHPWLKEREMEENEELLAPNASSKLEDDADKESRTTTAEKANATTTQSINNNTSSTRDVAESSPNSSSQKLISDILHR